MIDRRQFCGFGFRLVLAAVAVAPMVFAASGCGGGTPEGQATPNPEMNVDESGSPPDGKAKKKG